jgi:hypothetical protein
MNSLKVYAAVTGCALAVAALSGCYVSTEPGPGPGPGPVPIPVTGPTGTVTLAWTVDGSHSPPSCSQFGAYDLELVIRDRYQRIVTSTTAPCSDFNLTLPLPRGTYEGEATLIDSRSGEVSTTLPLQDISIVPGTDLTIDIDFPASSRL